MTRQGEEDLRYTGTAPLPAGHVLLATAYARTFQKNSAVLALGIRFADIEITATATALARSDADSKAHHQPQNPHELRGRGKSLRGRWLNWRGSTGLQLATLVAVSWPIRLGWMKWMEQASFPKPESRFMRRTVGVVSSQLGPHYQSAAPARRSDPRSCRQELA